MAEVDQSYRKKQAYMMLLVFVCIGVAIWGGNAALSVGAILAACGICFWAATLQPEPPKEEHHH
jgi:predicted signal transduction protein with EAL and GGDEF domain